MNNNYILTPDGELKHYGVIGMKWGVRKNPAKAYFKAHKKLRKIERVQQKHAKLSKIENAISLLGGLDDYAATRLGNSYQQWELRRYKEKWQKQMNKAFKDVDPKYIKEGERLLAEYDKKKSRKK